MTGSEREKLGKVQSDFRTIRRYLGLWSQQNGPNLAVDAALDDLERTYHLRFWTVVEAILRARHLTEFGAESSGLRHSVEALLGSGVAGVKVQDPATEASRLELWGELMTRDRNHLAHSRSGPPTLDLDGSGKLVETFLNQIGRTGAPPT